jgi:hypothetical protein
MVWTIVWIGGIPTAAGAIARSAAELGVCVVRAFRCRAGPDRGAARDRGPYSDTCSRLARFNATAEVLAAGGDKVKYFEGTPIPSSVLRVGMPLNLELYVDCW